MKNCAFTLAEVLITLAIIGVVAAMAIPSVISNAQQQEFKTGLRKAVSVLNSAITMNIALDGESPYDNHDLFRYLQRHMSVMKSTTALSWVSRVYLPDGKFLTINNSDTQGNAAFYTTDGMRFEFAQNNSRLSGEQIFAPDRGATTLHEMNISPTFVTTFHSSKLSEAKHPGCGSYGLSNNPNNTTTPPCAITVDVNGDRKPNPANTDCISTGCSKPYLVPSPNGKKLTDVFTIMVTESAAIPYGVVAQKAMYESQK